MSEIVTDIECRLEDRVHLRVVRNGLSEIALIHQRCCNRNFPRTL